MKATKAFLDTEFTHFFDPQLISVGLVAEDWRQLYLELPYDRSRCSAFVREAVWPLLHKDPEAVCQLQDLKSRVHAWLEWVRPRQGEVVLCFDFQDDWDLLVDAMDYEIPTWVTPRLLRSEEVVELMLDDYWRRNPGERPHHALHDAKALRYAFREESPDGDAVT